MCICLFDRWFVFAVFSFVCLLHLVPELLFFVALLVVCLSVCLNVCLIMTVCLFVFDFFVYC